MPEKKVIVAHYLIETPLEPERAAAILAGEQSCGTFTVVVGETEELRRRAGAEVLHLEELEPAAEPSLPSAYIDRRRIDGPWRRARIAVAYPIANAGRNLPTLAAIVAGNLFDLGETTGLRLLSLEIPNTYREHFAKPSLGIEGTRQCVDVSDRPLFGTIIKPNVGLSAEATAVLVESLCEAGVDFIKDDEVNADSDHAPLKERVPAVMDAISRYRDRSGRTVMMAFNVTDEFDAMRRHAELVERHGGACIMLSLNWCGPSAIEALRRSTPLALHGHRNGFGAFSRHPMLGISFRAYQTLYRLTGLDHLHVHGLGGKFADSDDEVADAARACLEPVAANGDPADQVMPVFSSGQWAGTIATTCKAVQGRDFMFLAGGGILAHPDGPAAGVASLRQAYEAVAAGMPAADYAARAPELSRALEFFSRSIG